MYEPFGVCTLPLCVLFVWFAAFEVAINWVCWVQFLSHPFDMPQLLFFARSKLNEAFGPCAKSKTVISDIFQGRSSHTYAPTSDRLSHPLSLYIYIYVYLSFSLPLSLLPPLLFVDVVFARVPGSGRY